MLSGEASHGEENLWRERENENIKTHIYVHSHMWGFLVDITYIHEYTLCLLYILHMCIHLTLLFTVCAYSTCTLHMYTVINYPKCCDRHEQVQ